MLLGFIKPGITAVNDYWQKEYKTKARATNGSSSF
jgi:hypothetical protein